MMNKPLWHQSDEFNLTELMLCEDPEVLSNAVEKGIIMNQIHLLDITEFDDTMAAFTSYVLGQTYPLKFNQMNFTPCSIKFGKAEIIYRMWLKAETGKDETTVAEFFIVADSDRQPMSMVSRIAINGEVKEDSIGYTSYSHKIQYHHDGLLELITAIPEQAPVTYYYTDLDDENEVKH